jgi:hypothetical protein
LLRLLGGTKSGNETAAKQMLQQFASVAAERTKQADELEKQFSDAASRKRMLGNGGGGGGGGSTKK